MSLSSLFTRRRPAAESASRYASLRRTFRVTECAEFDSMPPADAVVVLERWLSAEWVRVRQMPTREAARARLAHLRDEDAVVTRDRLIEAVITFCLWRANPALLPAGIPIVPDLPAVMPAPVGEPLVTVPPATPAVVPSGVALAWG